MPRRKDTHSLLICIVFAALAFSAFTCSLPYQYKFRAAPLYLSYPEGVSHVEKIQNCLVIHRSVWQGTTAFFATRSQASRELLHQIVCIDMAPRGIEVTDHLPSIASHI